MLEMRVQTGASSKWLGICLAALLAWPCRGTAQQPMPSGAPSVRGAILLPPSGGTENGIQAPEKLPPPETGPYSGMTADGSDGSPPSPFSWNHPGPDFWQQNPPYRILPRLGNFLVPPTGPGYYSLLDWIRDDYREAPPKFPYVRFAIQPFGFFDMDFRYLDNPDNQERDWSDAFHRLHVGDNWLFNTGGEFRSLYMDLPNFNLQGKYDHKELIRARIYGDLWFQDVFRVFVEFLDAQSYAHILPSGPFDVDHGDLLNAFVDVKLFDLYDKPAYVRVGRQELYFGSQRLISSLWWANTLRTFDGVRGFRQGENFDIDLFWVQPVIPRVTKFDWVDAKQNFTGLWTTYRPAKGQSIDIYDLFLDNQNKITKFGLTSGPYAVNTLGSRYAGGQDGFLWDVEGMVQLGNADAAKQNIIAGAATTGVGWHWQDVTWNPTLWGYFDYASGDPNPDKHGSFNTFNQLFPFNHYYSWTDLVGRQNIFNPNIHLWLFPTNWITIWTQYHHFWLASPKDALYNSAGVAILRDPTGMSGSNVGDEFDFIINFCLSKHASLLVSYDELFGGRFVRDNSKHPDASTTYISFCYRW
jgi:hypothetical protein